MSTKIQTVRTRNRSTVYFFHFHCMSQKSIVFSILRKYGHLSVKEIDNYAGIIFFEEIKHHTIRKYRELYETKYVGLVRNIAGYKPFQNKEKEKEYISNGIGWYGEIYQVPFRHSLAMFFRYGRVKQYQRIYAKYEALKP